MSYDVESALSRALAKASEPSKRSNKVKSGRASRRAYQTRKLMASVGGIGGSTIDAIYSDKEVMCVVVDREIETVTTFTAPMYQVPTGQLLGRIGCV